jgi:NADH-quinone oxidoreductase subunit I
MANLGKMERELIKNLYKKPTTTVYPFEKDGLNIPEGLRGKWEYHNPYLCTGCKICERSCPSEAIEMIQCRPEDALTKTGYRPICHYDRCLLCGQCVESCPRNVLTLNDDFEMVFLCRKDMIGY